MCTVQRRKVPIMKRFASRFVENQRFAFQISRGTSCVSGARAASLNVINSKVSLCCKSDSIFKQYGVVLSPVSLCRGVCQVCYRFREVHSIQVYLCSLSGLCHLTCEAVACTYGRHMNVQPGLPQLYLNCYL